MALWSPRNGLTNWNLDNRVVLQQEVIRPGICRIIDLCGPFDLIGRARKQWRGKHSSGNTDSESGEYNRDRLLREREKQDSDNDTREPAP